MMTADKRKLINECLRLSNEYPGKTAYGFICKDGTYHPTISEFVIRERMLDKEKIYCRALNGQLIL